MVKKFLSVCESIDEFNIIAPIYDSKMADTFLRNKLRLDKMDREYVIALHLDLRKNLIGYEVVAIGSSSKAIVEPALVYKSAILNNAAGIVLAHNHPSGSPRPSKEDQELTERLTNAGEILGIKFLDHLVIGRDRYYSFTDQEVRRKSSVCDRKN